ncbi:MAG: methylmalonyl Co-A mutase-associated GTPase MeaB [Deltaproteobacteria bacterium]|nr:methylmalonyl Co-A mutase-associated GTPase MeaB [Deltaproteobacteria bacterium]
MDLVERMLAGDRVALAKLMSRAENEAPDLAAILARIAPHGGRSYVIGITGPPGAGKSTLVDRLVGTLRGRGATVGVIAVDPSSPFSGGAVLGDRIRMQTHCLDPEVFIRSLSTRGRRGGLARATRQIARLLDAFGKDTILIETVGVGQTELDIMEVAQTVVVVLVPEAGDTIQVMKAGLLEIAHVLVVNKADREGALRMKAELEQMLQLRPTTSWSVPVLLTEATRDRGIDELAAAIDAHRRHVTTDGAARRATAEHRVREFLDVLGATLAGRIEARIDGAFAPLVARVRAGAQDPYAAALEVLGDREGLRRLVDGSG